MEQISKSEAARRWKISSSMVTKYIRDEGCPVRDDGRLDWELVDRWRKDNVLSHRSGSYKSRKRAAKVGGSTRVRDDFDRGYVAARADLRECLPVLIAVDGNGKTRESRIRMYLEIDSWLGRFAARGGNQHEPEELPAIDWSDCSEKIQELAKKTQRAVDDDFAKLEGMTL
jgi:hypothetical protein